MNQNQLAEFFDNSKQNIGQHIANMMEQKVKEIYAQFDQRRKNTEAEAADTQDLEELKALEQQIKNAKD
jgi:hypothetical protein